MQHLLDQDVTVHGIRQGLTHIDVLKRLGAFFGVHVQKIIVGASARGRRCFGWPVFRQLRIHAGWDANSVQLASFIAGERDIFIIHGQETAGFNDGRRIVPIKRVARDHCLFARLVFTKGIGAVAHQNARLCPLLAIGFDNGFGHRQDRGMHQHFAEIGQGGDEFDFKGQIVERFDAQISRGLFTCNHRRCVVDLHQFHVPRIGRGSGRIDQTLPRINIVICGDRLAVRPFRLGAQLEGVGLFVFRNSIADSTCIHEVA